ncbi:MAG: hypothetical protein U9N87_05650 [Planctomycetota bacterium]|nr:hypothetical protein [Planctomycetota bacterium]
MKNSSPRANADLALLIMATESLKQGYPIVNGRVESPLHNRKAAGPSIHIKNSDDEYEEAPEGYHKCFRYVQRDYRMSIERVAENSYLNIGDLVLPLSFGSIASEIRNKIIRDLIITFRIAPQEMPLLAKLIEEPHRA